MRMGCGCLQQRTDGAASGAGNARGGFKSPSWSISRAGVPAVLERSRCRGQGGSGPCDLAPRDWLPPRIRRWQALSGVPNPLTMAGRGAHPSPTRRSPPLVRISQLKIFPYKALFHVGAAYYSSLPNSGLDLCVLDRIGKLGRKCCVLSSVSMYVPFLVAPMRMWSLDPRFSLSLAGTFHQTRVCVPAARDRRWSETRASRR